MDATLIIPAPVIVISDMQQTYLGCELAEHRIGTGRICYYFLNFAVGQSHALSKRFRVITARSRQHIKSGPQLRLNFWSPRLRSGMGKVRTRAS